ncbi:conjugal transfer protein TraO [Chryseobacterium sp.]|uniref:conjugal transfer protein TraO n=1 Tax=Chryseobacterium sp. TaxID=1871047 RepID=UPI0011C89AFB|nr:conjugal transfer protein TraO [Chryseobacterium sp.]TXF78870.1 conjugal transfer protein TraO [Chryseobacterium sp.]
MNRIFSLMILFTISMKLQAQQMIPKQKGLELAYSVFPQSPEKQNYAVSAGLISYAKKGNYFFCLAEYSRKYYEYTNVDIPIDIYLFNGGYSVYLWGDAMRNVNFNIGLGGVVGYEEVNAGVKTLSDSAVINSARQFIYGGSGKLSIESYLSEHLVFLVNGQLRFLHNSQPGGFYSLFGCGVRFNF